ncbi:MAG: MFS transporter, partial [Anaerolineales bacterium]|nr:MFS transporter [Anaerolineales bacterium]
FVLMGFAKTPAMLFWGGVLAALGGALFEAPLKASVAALAPAAQLGQLYARVGVLQNLARTVGPIIGGVLILYDFAWVGAAAAGFFLGAFVLVLVWMPAVQVSNEKQPMSQGLNLAFHDRPFLLYTALMMGFWFMWTQLSIAMPLEVKALTGSDSSVGVLFTVNAVIAIVLQVPLLRLAQRFLRPMPMIIVGIVSMAFSLGLVALVETVWQLYVSVFFFAAGIVLVMPNAETIAASLANPTARGAYFGVNSLALAVGGGIGHIAGGALVDYALVHGVHMLPWVTFGLVGMLTAVSMLHFYRHNRTRMTPGLVLAVAD